MPHLRPATLTDIPALIELENTCFTEDKLSPQRFRQLIKTPTAELIIAEDQQTLLGYSLLFYRKNSKKARLYSFAVNKQHRQQGIAHLLQESLEKQVLRRGCHTIILEVRPDNTPAIHFYQKHGYAAFGTYIHFYEDGADAIRMEKKLNAEEKSNLK